MITVPEAARPLVEMRPQHDFFISIDSVLFFPINPGHEDESWQRFYEKGVHKFMAEKFEGDYEASLIAKFEKFMPEVPPWEK